MPQLSQIAEIYASQFFWLLIVFAIIYFGIGKGMVSKIEATMDHRDAKIADDLKAAQSARAIADSTEEAYRTRMDTARTEAARATQDAKAQAARDAEARVRAADADLAVRADAADAQLAQARTNALQGIEDVAAEAAQDIVSRVSGISVDRDAAARAVKSAMAYTGAGTGAVAHG